MVQNQLSHSRFSLPLVPTIVSGPACTSERYRILWISPNDDTTLTQQRQMDAQHRWKHSPICSWNSLTSECTLQSNNNQVDSRHSIALVGTKDNVDDESSIVFEYDCPLGPQPYPDHPPAVLPDWLGRFRDSGLLSNVTLTDLSWPGSHDSLSYDLSLTVSDDGRDKFQKLFEVLHILSGGQLHLLPGELEEFGRMQAKTQQLTVSQQLDNGIRFVDFRLMLEKGSSGEKWYSMHFMQSKRVVQEYWREIRAWLDLHPDEIIMLWLSRDGNPTATGHRQYPDVSREQKQGLWKDYLEIFDGLLLDSRDASIFKTPLEEMLTKNYRVVTWASDYKEFTNWSPFALNAARIQNRFDAGKGVFSEDKTLQKHITYFRSARTNNAAARILGHFSLLAMNSQAQNWQVLVSAKKRFLGWSHDLLHTCSSHLDMPDAPDWCPDVLLDIAQLASYYNQHVFEFALSSNDTARAFGEKEEQRIAFPNAIYLDALDFDGTVRTGSQLLNGADRGGPDEDDSKYAYVDTVLMYNVQQLCSGGKSEGSSAECQSLANLFQERRQRYPFRLWEDTDRARYADWPRIEEPSVVLTSPS